MKYEVKLEIELPDELVAKVIERLLEKVEKPVAQRLWEVKEVIEGLEQIGTKVK